MMALLRRAWASIVLPHALLGVLTLVAFHAQTTYRVPSLLGVLALPVIGIALGVLSVVILVTRLADRAAGESGRGHRVLMRLIVLVALPLAAGSLLVPVGMADRGVRTLLVSGSLALVYLTVVGGIARLAAPALAGAAGRALRGVEYALALVVAAFALYGLVCYVNGALDRSAPVEVRSQVLQIGRAEAEFYEVLPYAWTDFWSWRADGGVERILLSAAERAALWPGQGVIMEVRSGALGIPWVARVKRDEEWQYRRVLEIAPTAAGPRKALVNLYIGQRRWPEAAAAALDYRRHYPKDFEYLRGVASTLMFMGHDAAAVTLIEPFATSSSNPEVLTMAGWALHRAARRARSPASTGEAHGEPEQGTRGIAMLEQARQIDPGNPWTHYYLGYAYRDVGRLEEALAAFQKVLDRVPAHADAKRQATALRERLFPPAPGDVEQRQPAAASRRSSINIR
jgi:tetratricopeptide (TPR) repeat protein